MPDLLQFRDQFPILVKLQHDVCPAHQLTIDVDLWESGPIPAQVDVENMGCREQVDIDH